MTNDQLSRLAAERLIRETSLIVCAEEQADIKRIIAEVYADAVAELERLRLLESMMWFPVVGGGQSVPSKSTSDCMTLPKPPEVTT